MTWKLLTLDMVPIWAGLTDPKIIERHMANLNNKNKQEQTPNLPTVITGGDEIKEQNSRYNLSKFDHDLYHEEDDKNEKIIRVKRFSLPNKGERWKIMEDNKVMFIVEGAKLSKKERDFLCTVDGVNFLISQYKQGISSFNSLKKEIKKKLQ